MLALSFAASPTPAADSSRALPRSTPEEQGISSSAILEFIEAADKEIDAMHSFMLVRHGHVVAEGWWRPYSADRPHRLYSLSKSFTSTAASFAAAEGLLDLDDTVVSHFPEFDADITDPGSRSMRIRHVAAMASGHELETLGRALGATASQRRSRSPRPVRQRVAGSR